MYVLFLQNCTVRTYLLFPRGLRARCDVIGSDELSNSFGSTSSIQRFEVLCGDDAKEGGAEYCHLLASMIRNTTHPSLIILVFKAKPTLHHREIFN